MKSPMVFPYRFSPFFRLTSPKAHRWPEFYTLVTSTWLVSTWRSMSRPGIVSCCLQEGHVGDKGPASHLEIQLPWSRWLFEGDVMDRWSSWDATWRCTELLKLHSLNMFGLIDVFYSFDLSSYIHSFICMCQCMYDRPTITIQLDWTGFNGIAWDSITSLGFQIPSGVVKHAG